MNELFKYGEEKSLIINAVNVCPTLAKQVEEPSFKFLVELIFEPVNSESPKGTISMAHAKTDIITFFLEAIKLFI
ncbi:MAG: hypothetical protein CME64_10640 [Halobacteriovoraceae bacterium]|nr:hypothetical protein [Halobacteriovoraceae bacterium]